MGTVKQTLDIARSQLGVKESPPNSNIVLYNDYYWGKGQYGSWAAWCVVFCVWCCDKSGVKLPTKTASCGEMMNAAKSKGMWVTSNFKPGDLTIFDFSGKKKTTEHIGIVESVTSTGVVTIEGNTSTGNNSNGGEVMRRTRANQYIIGAVRPVYDKETATTTTTKKEDELDMTVDEFINKLTDKQAYTLLTKAQNYAGTLSEPEWSKNEGHWAKAKNKGLVDGTRPEGNLKRDEFIAVIGRAGLL